MAYRLDQLEARTRDGVQAVTAPPPPRRDVEPEAAASGEPPEGEAPPVDVDQVQQVWQAAVLPAVRERSIPLGSVLAEARPIALSGSRLTIEFPPAGAFHRTVAEKPENETLLRDVLAETTGHRLAVDFVVGEDRGETEAEEEAATSEEEFVSLFKSTFDAREIEGSGD
jgi:hypothetical protein